MSVTTAVYRPPLLSKFPTTEVQGIPDFPPEKLHEREGFTKFNFIIMVKLEILVALFHYIFKFMTEGLTA